MIVYGDQRRVEPAAAALEDLAGQAMDLEKARDRRDAATRLLIDAGEVAQGLLDVEFDRRGCDDWGEMEEACAALTVAAARLRDEEVLSAFHEAIDQLRRSPLPETIRVTGPEGFAFYALDPELYAAAARRFRTGDDGPLVVIGIRSIGTSLAAVVAVAAGASDLPVTVRPTGHPFQRTVAIGPALRNRLLAASDQARFAIVDEGPGLSGSSFGAVADWLEDQGVDRERIHIFPGHGGSPGPRACERHRARWATVARHWVEFDEHRRQSATGASWFEPGAEATPAEEISGGRWRAAFFPDPSAWPPSHTYQERRKYLYRSGGVTRLAKFAGLDRGTEDRLAIARALERAGYGPPVLGWRRGFLIGEWLDGVRPASSVRNRDGLLETVANYLAFRAREFPAPPEAPGANVKSLLDMAVYNTQERLGAGTADEWGRWREHLPRIAGRLRRVVTDNRLHAWEWLARPDGRWIKADAIDHASAHDLVGAQDLAWDVAGAIVELDLDDSEAEDLVARLARRAPFRPDPRVLDFHRLAYMAFQLGYYEMARQAHADTNPEEAARLAAAADRYAAGLGRELRAAP